MAVRTHHLCSRRAMARLYNGAERPNRCVYCYKCKSGLATPVIKKSAQADFVCVAAISIASSCCLLLLA